MDQVFKDVENSILHLNNEIKVRKEMNILENRLADAKYKATCETINIFEKHCDIIDEKFKKLLEEFQDVKKENPEEE